MLGAKWAVMECFPMPHGAEPSWVMVAQFMEHKDAFDFLFYVIDRFGSGRKGHVVKLA